MNEKKNMQRPEDDPRFHDTYKLLRKYRDVTYSLKVVIHQMEIKFQIEHGTSIDDFLNSIYEAGANIGGTEIEVRAKSIERSNQMLKLLDSSIDLLRHCHKQGETYYWILYYSFLSPQEMSNTDHILRKLEEHMTDISLRTYYRKRKYAINALGGILWGYTSKDTLAILDQFFPESKT